MDLPAEIWAQIFNLAADDDLIFQYGFQTSLSVHAWWKGLFGKWLLRSPREALNYIQKQSYFTKKSIVSTCRSWRGIGSETLFRYLFFDHPSKLLALCKVLQSSSATATTISSSLGWWTRRIHLANRDHRDGIAMSDLEKALLLVMKHCPNLEIFVVDWQMGSTFGPVADSLAFQASRSLRTVHWQVPSDELPKVIWALDSLPYIVAAHIHLTPTTTDTNDDDEDDNTSELGSVKLGAASNLHLKLRYLQQLSLKGRFVEFLEQATGWSFRSLRSVSLDYGNNRNELPDVVSFLKQHGKQLQFLDINCIPMLNVSKILETCPNLNTFAFNADWRIMPNDGITSELVRIPHFNITTIGLHGLYFAFGVGHGAAQAQGSPITAQVIRKSNDLNVAALNKLNFPKLENVRVLSPVVLMDLERENGPSEKEGGVQRYDNWWNSLSRAGIRLEDCTGAPLGTLPQDEFVQDDEGEEEEEEEEWEQDWEEEEEEEEEEEAGEEESSISSDDDEAFQSAEETFTLGNTNDIDEDDEEDEEEDEEEEEVENELDPGKKHVNELKRLLDECRAMEREKEELPYTSMMNRSSQYSGNVDYGTIYQQMTGNGSTGATNNSPQAPSPTYNESPSPGEPEEFEPLTFGARRGPRRGPRVSFGISDVPPTEEALRRASSTTSSRRSSARYTPPSNNSRRTSSVYAPSDSRRTSSVYAPSESDNATLLGWPEASPAFSETSTLVPDDNEYYEYDDDDEYDQEDDDDEDEDEDEDEDLHPVSTLRKLLEECRAMREESNEESMFGNMMYGGGPMMGMGGMPGMGYGMGAPMGYTAPQAPGYRPRGPTAPINSYYTSPAYTSSNSGTSSRR